jgi:glycosyltransferase involved in cell wall biosynthesis
MKILHLHERTEIKGGVEIYISQLQKLLPLQQHDSYWLGIDEYGEINKVSEFGKGIILETSDQKDILNFLESFIRRNAIDVINIHNIYNRDIIELCFSLLPVVKFSHSPVIVCPGGEKFWRYSEKPCEIKYGLHCFKHIYSQGCANRHPKRVIKAWSHVNFEVKSASKRYNTIIVMSDYIKNGLLECGIDDKKILCNPYFTHPVNYIPGKGNTGYKRLLFIGRLISSKGPHLLITMFYDLAKENENVVLDIVGDGIMRSELETLARELGIANKVFFHGWLKHDEVNAKLTDCFLLVFPSIYPEAFGITGIEAMMHSKPVVGFDTGGVSTWLKNDVTGYLVERGNIKDMAAKVQLLINEPPVYERMSKDANEYALVHYSPHVHINKLLQVYNNCISLN